jgi:hypothetical protein
VPPKPPCPRLPPSTAREVAPHVRAATGLVQARPNPATAAPALRSPVPHVQAALGRGRVLQQQPNAIPRSPASHVRAAVAQAKTAPAGRPPVPGIEARRPGGVLQRAAEKKSLTNVANYSSLLDAYDESEVREVLEETGLSVRGHHSGTSGDGMNSATRQDLDQLGKALKKKKETEKKSKKKPKIREQAPMTELEKARAMGDRIFEAQGQGGMVAYTEYLDKQLGNEKITEDEYDGLVGYYLALQ